MRIGYLECFSGISGDMLLGALVDAGVPFALLEETTAALNVGAHLEMRKVSRGGLAGTKVDVIVENDHAAAHDHMHGEAGHIHDHDHPEHPTRMRMIMAQRTVTPMITSMRTALSTRTTMLTNTNISRIARFRRSLRIIADAPLTDQVKSRASLAFQLLGEAEAAIHSIPIEKVHFHEVGAVDTIVDIVCSAVGCAHLGVDRWLASPLNVGSGTVKCAHGTLPVPAPATLALLGNAPVYAAGPAMERVTPTGAAMLRMLDVEYASLPAHAHMRHRATEPEDATRLASQICCGCWWAKRPPGILLRADCGD